MHIWYNLTLLGIGFVTGVTAVIAVAFHMAVRSREDAERQRHHRIARRFPTEFAGGRLHAGAAKRPRWSLSRGRDWRAQ